MNKRVIDSAYRWWQAMFLSENELKKLGIRPAPSAQKAQLKRCVNIDAAMLTDGFRALWLSFPEEFANESKPELIECWAAIALTLVFVKQNSEVELASLAGQKVGSVVRLTIPAAQAYSTQGSGIIPANAPLEFIVEIHSAKEA